MRKLILKLLNEHGPMSIKQMAHLLGTTPQHIRYYIRVMDLEVVGIGESTQGGPPKIYGIKK